MHKDSIELRRENYVRINLTDRCDGIEGFTMGIVVTPSSGRSQTIAYTVNGVMRCRMKDREELTLIEMPTTNICGKYGKWYYMGMRIKGFEWQGFIAGMHHFTKKAAKTGSLVILIKATDSDIENGNLVEMIKLILSKHSTI